MCRTCGCQGSAFPGNRGRIVSRSCLLPPPSAFRGVWRLTLPRLVLRRRAGESSAVNVPLPSAGHTLAHAAAALAPSTRSRRFHSGIPLGQSAAWQGLCLDVAGTYAHLGSTAGGGFCLAVPGAFGHGTGLRLECSAAPLNWKISGRSRAR